ncbi:MAG TPA: hypothetical protein PK037_14580 [Saprospiraceae bacterium]|nr:hypothetical protein [Saprospiraceae bacterium]
MASQSPLPSDQNNLKWVYRMFIALLLFLFAAWVVWLYFSNPVQKEIPDDLSENSNFIQQHKWVTTFNTILLHKSCWQYYPKP